MTPEQKLNALAQLWHAARALKSAWLRQRHPEWSEEKIERGVREILLHARS
jgi:hypothetical protein